MKKYMVLTPIDRDNEKRRYNPGEIIELMEFEGELYIRAGSVQLHEENSTSVEAPERAVEPLESTKDDSEIESSNEPVNVKKKPVK